MRLSQVSGFNEDQPSNPQKSKLRDQPLNGRCSKRERNFPAFHAFR